MKPSMSEDQEFIYNSIFTQVKSGFFSKEDIKDHIVEEIDDNGMGDEVSEEWAFAQIDSLFDAQQSASESWNENTDMHKLIAAFDDLAQQNLIALHYPGYTVDDGEYEVSEVERTLRENGKKSVGYCFYHGQDMERAVRGEGLLISYQKIDNVSDSVTKEVAKTIIATLEKHGLKTQWDGKPTSKILLPEFDWKNHFDENKRDLFDFNEVIDIILENKI